MSPVGYQSDVPGVGSRNGGEDSRHEHFYPRSGRLTVTTDGPRPPDNMEITDARWTPGERGGTLEVRAESTRDTANLTVFRGSDIDPIILRPLGDGRYEGEASFGRGATTRN